MLHYAVSGKKEDQKKKKGKGRIQGLVFVDVGKV